MAGIKNSIVALVIGIVFGELLLELLYGYDLSFWWRLGVSLLVEITIICILLWIGNQAESTNNRTGQP
jgi:hypothetical protein